MDDVIAIENFSFSFGGPAVLDNVNFRIRSGEYVSIIGPNGVGKSTLLRCIVRIHRGGSGLISVGGSPLEGIAQRDLARLIAFVPQSDGRFLPFSVREFVMMSRYPYLSPFTTYRAEDRTAVGDALALTGTRLLEHRHIETLSGGERRSVAIAAALAQGTSIILLDEPTTFLDPGHEADILALIARINRERGITIIQVTHNINHAALYSDRIGIMKNGAFVFEGLPSAMMSNDVLAPVYGRSFRFIDHPDTGFPVIVPEMRTHA